MDSCRCATLFASKHGHPVISATVAQVESLSGVGWPHEEADFAFSDDTQSQLSAMEQLATKPTQN